jgi:hypothetical protein
MFVFSFKRSFATVLGVAMLALTFLFADCVKDDFLLAGKAYEQSYYLYSASSWAKEVKGVELWELPFVEGKSAQLEFEKEEQAKAYMLALVKEKNAYLQKAEFSGGTESYYYYCASGAECVRVSGLPVNLHIAVHGRFVSVGEPMIFGGY